MKISTIVLVLITASTSALASPTIDNDREYRVEKSLDTDLRVIEFTPPGRPGMTCIYVTGGNDGGIDCFPKKPSTKHVGHK